jgi:hypothetical protein
MKAGDTFTKITSPAAAGLHPGDIIQFRSTTAANERARTRRIVAFVAKTTVTVRDLTNWEWRWYRLKRTAKRAWKWFVDGIAEAGQMYGRNR